MHGPWHYGYFEALAGQPADPEGLENASYMAGYAKGQQAREERDREDTDRGQILRLPPLGGARKNPEPVREKMLTVENTHNEALRTAQQLARQHGVPVYVLNAPENMSWRGNYWLTKDQPEYDDVGVHYKVYPDGKVNIITETLEQGGEVERGVEMPWPCARRNFEQAAPRYVFNWRNEFGPSHKPPAWVLAMVERGILKDNSWRNDMAASFIIEGENEDLYIWVDDEDPEERTDTVWGPEEGFGEFGPRYTLSVGSHEHGEHRVLWKGDDPSILRDHFFRARFEMGL